MPTHTDYKIKETVEENGVIRQTVRYYEGEYQDVEIPDWDGGTTTESRYVRTGLIDEIIYEFAE